MEILERTEYRIPIRALLMVTRAVFASSPWLGMRDASGLNMVMAPQYLSYDEAYGQRPWMPLRACL